MEKQNKVVNKIRRSIDPTNGNTLGKKNNDECYTSMQDILNELSYWANLGKFKGKNIICPCDWDITDDEEICSITIEYKEDGIAITTNNVYKTVKSVKYKRWIPSLFDDEEDNAIETEQKFNVVEVNLKEEEIEDFLRNKLTCNFIKTFTQMARRWGIKSITASGYNPETGRGVKFQDVDYTKYDICCTNPPFSLYADFMKCIVGKIDFVCLAPFLNRVTPNIGLPLMLKQAYLGYGVHLGISFANPTKENNYSGVKGVACDWITSWPEAQDERNKQCFKTGVDYELYKDEYPIMENMTMKDGTHPIKVVDSTYSDDYNGWMFGSINILDKLNQDEYEWYGTNYKKYYNTEHPENNPFDHKASDQMLIHNGRQYFHGIVFRKKIQ